MKKKAETRIGKKHLMMGFLFIIILTGLILTQRKGGEIAFFETEKISFEGHQKVSETSVLRMTFPEKMDAVSLKEHMDAPIKGEGVWEGETLIFQPEEPLKTGETLTFSVSRDARVASGKPLNKDTEYRFTVAGPPVLSSHYPSADATDIYPESKIHLVFDRPMVPLSAVQGDGAKKYSGHWPVTIKPAISGEWRWLGTTTIEFTPKQALTPATTYTVSVPKGIKSLNGDLTAEDASWSFETMRPLVLSTEPYDDDSLNGPDSRITLTFNQEIDLQKAVEFIRINQITDEKENKMTSLSYDLKYGFEETDGRKKENRKDLVIVPVKPLSLNTTYQVTAGNGIRGIRGDLGSREDFMMHFSTVGDFKVSEPMVFYKEINLEFNNPIDNNTLKGHIHLDPEPEGWEDVELKTSEWSDDRYLYIYAGLKPSTRYTLTLSDKIKDQFGQPLVEPFTHEFTTEALDPDLIIRSQGDFGIFEKDLTPIYPFESVNISRIDLEMARIPFEQFIRLRQNQKDTYSYKPDIQNYIGYQTFSLKTENVLDKWEKMYFDIEKESKRTLIPGIYILRAQAPEYLLDYGNRQEPNISTQYFSLTNNALTLKYSGKKALVWLVSMKTGLPVTDAAIVFYNLKGEKVLTGTTDSEGFFETAIDLVDFQTNNNEWNPEFWVTATKDEDFTFLGSDWNNGLEPWNFGIWEAFKGPKQADYDMDAYLYTERQAYRPGDTVYFKGVTRLRDKNGFIGIPDNYEVSVKIHDAQYNEIYNKTLKLSEFGSFSGEVPLTSEASLGRYELSINLLPEDKVDSNYQNHSFYVLEYRKPEYRVEVLPDETDYFSGEKAGFTIAGHYYFGAPMSDANVTWNAVMSDYWFNRYTDGWYSFALEDNWCWRDCSAGSENITAGEGKLDQNGNLKISFPVSLENKGTSQMITLHADISDPNNQVVSNRETVPVHKADLYVGIRMTDYVVTPNEKAQVEIVTVAPDGSLKPGEKVTLSLFSREWNTIRKKSVDGYYYYENEPKDTFIRKVSVATGPNGKTTGEIQIGSGGSYRIVAEASDSKGRSVKAGTGLYAFSQTYINWPRANNDRIEVIADKPEYKVGDTAKLLIKSPYQGEGVKALITVERENIITRQVIDVKSNAQPVEIPVTADLIPNAYVSAVIIKARTGEAPDKEGESDTGMPAFKMGYVKLLVETQQKELRINLETDKKKYGPNETVHVNLTTSDHDGKPVAAELSLGVVDLSVQALLGFRMPDLIRLFYEERGLGVQTSQMLTYLIEAFKPGSKGGGGGDAESRARSDFKDTAYWNPALKTDQNGKASLSFRLPDNLTTWQLLAIGHTKNHQYGAAVLEIIETKKTIVRPIRPRFAVEGDQVSVGATVHNFTDETQNFRVTLNGEGFTTNGSAEKMLTIKPDQMAKVIFPVTVQPVTEVSFHFKAEGKNAVDEIIERIPVYEFGTPQSVATAGFTEESVNEQVYLPSEKEARRGTVTATISPTLAAYLPKGLTYLAQFPYGCAEQTASSFLPNVALKTLQRFEAFKIMDDATLEKNITTGLAKLYSYQQSNGGFGYWSGSESNPYLTAYIVYALEMTGKAGYSVDTGVLFRAGEYLRNILRSQNPEDQIDLATRAYILFVLAENGKTETGLLNNLYEKRKNLPLFSRAYLAMALSEKGKAQIVLQEIIDQVKIDARGSHFEEKNEGYWRFSMNTNTRTTALVTQAMVRLMPDHDLLPKLVRYLLDVREHGRWDTTQSTVTSLFALTEFLQETGELDADFRATVTMAGEEVLSHDFGAGNILTREQAQKTFQELGEEAYAGIAFGKEGQGRLYYDLSMDYFLTRETLEQTDQGIGITRTISPLNQADKAFRVQGTYKTKLTITVPEDRHYVAVASPLPAGFEPIDFTLQTTQHHLAGEINLSEDNWSWWNPVWYFNHIEFRDEEIFLFADFLPAGKYEYEYLTRATTAGKFRERPARAWEMYYPEIFGQTNGGWFEIKE